MTESVGIRHRDVRSGQRGQRRATRGEDDANTITGLSSCRKTADDFLITYRRAALKSASSSAPATRLDRAKRVTDA
jgi:hypothetical protein